jgi:hypothetical protein
LGPDFDVSRMLVVDIMHEFELGVWKALFVHAIRILDAAVPGGRLVALLDERYSGWRFSPAYYIATPFWGLTTTFLNRYRKTPQFSHAIRRFTNNVSEMKKLAARDFEDLLQVNDYLSFSGNFVSVLIVGLVLSVPSRRLRVSSMNLTTRAS